MNFADVAKNESRVTRTENGALALNSSGDRLLDLYGTVGALREADSTRIESLFAEAYNEDALTATKILFYARDIRGGIGERKVFRTLIRYLANYHKNALIPNLDLIGVYGRYDDLYELIGTPAESEMWNTMKSQFEDDVKNLSAGEGHAVSLLAKWIKTADASSQNTRKLGILTAKKLGYSVYDFKRLVRALRKRIGVVESLMSAGKWNEIKYSAVPSRAMMVYRNAFMKHDTERFNSFVNKAVNGEEKINSGTLYPYDLIEKIFSFGWHRNLANDDPVVEAQWRQLPNYVDGEYNALVIADTSGSMQGRPMNTSIGLAIYFAERNKGVYHNLWMSFSESPTYQVLRGETLAQKIRNMNMDAWGSNTNLKKAFELVLKTAIDHNISNDDIPKSLIVISDMEIDDCTDDYYNSGDNWTFYDSMKRRYASYGYDIPNVIFWNVNSRHDVFHADSKRKGVQLCSGQSASVFKQVMQCIGMTPLEAMYHTINSERYEPIRVE